MTGRFSSDPTNKVRFLDTEPMVTFKRHWTQQEIKVTVTPQELIAAADRLSDAVARHYRAQEDSVNDIDASRKAMFARELEYSKLREAYDPKKESITAGEQVAQKIEKLIARFVGEKWAHENRKMDVLRGMRLGARIARGELAQDVETP